jgi:hypothetical protein
VAANTTGVTVEIPEIELRNLGEEGGGMTTAQLSNLVVKTLLTAVARQGVNLPGALVGELEHGLRGVAGLPGAILHGASESLGATAGDAVRRLGDEAVDDLGALGRKAGGALGGLLGRDGEEKK